MPYPMFLNVIRDYMRTNKAIQDTIHQVTSNSGAHPDFILNDGLLLFKNKIWLDPNHPFHSSLIEEFHTTPIGGHMGFAKTLHCL